MERTARVPTENVRKLGSRSRKDNAILRAQFEQFLELAMADTIPEDIDTARGDRIRERIDARYVTLTALSKDIDATPKSVGRWCAGLGVGRQFRQPLAEALGTTWEYLSTGQTHMPPVADVMKRLEEIEDKLDELIRLIEEELLERDVDAADPPDEGSDDESASDAPESPG